VQQIQSWYRTILPLQALAHLHDDSIIRLPNTGYESRMGTSEPTERQRKNANRDPILGVSSCSPRRCTTGDNGHDRFKPDLATTANPQNTMIAVRVEETIRGSLRRVVDDEYKTRLSVTDMAFRFLAIQQSIIQAYEDVIPRLVSSTPCFNGIILTKSGDVQRSETRYR